MNKILSALMAIACFAFYSMAHTLVGSTDGYANVGNVTGGSGGDVVYPTTLDGLDTLMDNDNPYVIVIKGTIDLEGNMHTLRSDKTIIGEGTDAKIINGGFESGNKYSNVIIQNIEFIHSPDDLIKMYGAQRFWVDHCTFSDGDTVDETCDGLFDISNAANYITISNCKFFNHSKNILVGAKDGNTADTITRATFHHNWFKGTYQRNPRVRYASVHCYNNYYDSNTIYSIVSACDARVVLENNYFKNVQYPIHIGYDDSPAGKLDTSNNIFDNCGSVIVSNGETGSKYQAVSGFEHTWSPKSDYSYTMLDPQDVPAYVMANAGVFKSSTLIEQYKNASASKRAVSKFVVALSNNIYRINGVSNAAIYDVMGKKIKDIYKGASGRDIIFNATSLKSGLYFIAAQNGSGRCVQKVNITE